VKEDQSNNTYHVENANGVQWWYHHEALEKATGERLSVGDMVILIDNYADFGDAKQGPLKPGAGLRYAPCARARRQIVMNGLTCI